MIALLSTLLYAYAVIGILLLIYATLAWKPGESHRARDAALAGILILFFVANFAIIPQFLFGAKPMSLDIPPSPVAVSISPVNGSTSYEPIVSVVNLYRRPITVTISPSWGHSQTITTQDMIFQVKLPKFPPKSIVHEITDKNSGAKIEVATGIVKVTVDYAGKTLNYEYTVSYYRPEYTSVSVSAHVPWYKEALVKLLEYAIGGILKVIEKLAVFLGSLFNSLLNFVSGGTLAPSNALVFLTVMPVKEMFILPTGQYLISAIYYTMVKIAFPLIFTLIIIDLLYRSYVGDERMLRNLFYDVAIAGFGMIFGLKLYGIFAAVINTIIAYIGIDSLTKIAASISNWLGSAVIAATMAIAIKIATLEIISPTILSFYAAVVFIFYFVFIALAYLRLLSIMAAVALIPFSGIFYIIPPLRGIGSRMISFIIKQGLAGVMAVIIFKLLAQLIPYPLLGPIAMVAPIVIMQASSAIIIGRPPYNLSRSVFYTFRNIYRAAFLAPPAEAEGYTIASTKGNDDNMGGTPPSSGGTTPSEGGGASGEGEMVQMTTLTKPMEEQGEQRLGSLENTGREITSQDTLEDRGEESELMGISREEVIGLTGEKTLEDVGPTQKAMPQITTANKPLSESNTNTSADMSAVVWSFLAKNADGKITEDELKEVLSSMPSKERAVVMELKERGYPVVVSYEKNEDTGQYEIKKIITTAPVDVIKEVVSREFQVQIKKPAPFQKERGVEKVVMEYPLSEEATDGGVEIMITSIKKEILTEEKARENQELGERLVRWYRENGSDVELLIRGLRLMGKVGSVEFVGEPVRIFSAKNEKTLLAEVWRNDIWGELKSGKVFPYTNDKVKGVEINTGYVFKPRTPQEVIESGVIPVDKEKVEFVAWPWERDDESTLEDLLEGINKSEKREE